MTNRTDREQPVTSCLGGSPSSLDYFPDGSWQFDERVAAVFDDMLRRSIPGYAQMRDLCFQLGKEFVQPGTSIVDLGCARGEGLEPLVRHFGKTIDFLGVDLSFPMLDAARARFADLDASSHGDFRQLDLAHEYPQARASLTLCILTLQFVPVERRQQILKEALAQTCDGGGLILVEKIRGTTPRVDAMLIQLYRRFKRSQGYSDDAIEAKDRSLQDVLVPLTAADNEKLLAVAGFSEIECFWRCLNFAGWLARKPG